MQEKNNNSETEITLSTTTIPSKLFRTNNYFWEGYYNLSRINIDTQGLKFPLKVNIRDPIVLTREGLNEFRIDQARPFCNKSETPLNKFLRFQEISKQQHDIFYQFKSHTDQVKPCHRHEQMRRCLKFTGPNELIYQTKVSYELLDLTVNKTFPVLFLPEEHSGDYSRNPVTSFDIIKDKSHLYFYLCFGAMNGVVKLHKIHIKVINRKIKMIKYNLIKQDNITHFETQNVLINHITFTNDIRGMFIATNAKEITYVDIQTLQLTCKYKYTVPINNFAFNEEYNIVGAVCDASPVIIFDTRSTELVHQLKGHNDHGFDIKFDNEFTMATGNQDISCILWDVRKLGNDCAYKRLYGRIHPIGSVHFVNGGKVVYPENEDYLHVYDMKKDKYQEFQFFGETSGCGVNPLNGDIYVGYYFLGSGGGLYAFENVEHNLREVFVI